MARKMVICSNCEKEFSFGTPYQTHYRSCSKRPEKEVLEQLVQGKPVWKLAKEMGVGRRTIFAWMKHYEIELPRGFWNKQAPPEPPPGIPERDRLMADVLELGCEGKLAHRHGVAVKEARAWIKELGPVVEFAPGWGYGRSSCICNWKWMCQRFLDAGLWVMCERPMITDVMEAVRNGHKELLEEVLSGESGQVG